MSILRRTRHRLASIRNRLDGWLHRHRRRRSAKRLQQIAPTSVLVVCLGNICRSPYAQWAIHEQAPGSLTVRSAGFIGPGRSPPPEALAAARSRGIDHSVHRSRLVTQEMIDSADAVLVFERLHIRRLRPFLDRRRHHIFFLGDFDPRWSGRRAILDPWGKPELAFRETFERIDRCIDGLFDALRSNLDRPEDARR